MPGKLVKSPADRRPDACTSRGPGTHSLRISATTPYIARQLRQHFREAAMPHLMGLALRADGLGLVIRRPDETVRDFMVSHPSAHPLHPQLQHQPHPPHPHPHPASDHSHSPTTTSSHPEIHPPPHLPPDDGYYFHRAYSTASLTSKTTAADADRRLVGRRTIPVAQTRLASSFTLNKHARK